MKRRQDANARAAKQLRMFNPGLDLGLGTIQGPKYPANSDSFVLRSIKYTSDWDEIKCPNGVVPVVVNPLLVKGLQPDHDPLTQDQMEGIQFLFNRFEGGKGGILAHDCGLGKTRTAIVLIATLLEQSSGSKRRSTPGINKCIVIAPKNAVAGWKREFQKWVPSKMKCQVEVIWSGQRNGWEIVKKFKKAKDVTDVLILSYDSFKKYNSKYEEGFASYLPGTVGVVICDEAHCLKNENTDRVKSLKNFKGANNIWFGLTGTPYQNNLDEFCSFVKFFQNDIFQGIPKKKNYRKHYCMPITKCLKKFSRLGETERALLTQLREVILPAFHYKLNTLKLEKHEMTVIVPLKGHPDYSSSEHDYVQHTMYQKLVEKLKVSQLTFLEKLDFLHKMVAHPEYCVKDLPLESGFNDIVKDYTKHVEDIDGPATKLELPIHSAKIYLVSKMAMCLIERNKQNTKDRQKMIIVSYSREVLRLVKRFFTTVLKTSVVEYDGDKSEEERSNSIASFQNDDKVEFLLLSLKAGGTALTLTRGNHIVLMEPDFNPATDRQAIARIYRHSQTRPVYIYRLLCTGTLEEVKFILQLGKDDMAQCFTPNGSTDVQTAYNEAELLEYHSNSRSYIRDIIDSQEIQRFNDDDLIDRAFAEELQKSNHYDDVFKVPENLEILKSVWVSKEEIENGFPEVINNISYTFHVQKKPTEMERLIFEDS